MAKINGGYYIKARCIKESEIADCPPHFREIWDWLMANANHKDRKVSGRTIKRGQCFTSKKEILDCLKWKVGYRVERYKTHQYENSMKFLRSRGMVAVTKTVRGIIVTVLNYDKYQDPKNYESRTESRNESRTQPDGTVTINKNGKNDKKILYSSFLLNDGTKYQAKDEFIKVLKESYPAVNIENEFKNISAWCYSNKAKRKTNGGAKKFVNAWMARASKNNQPEQTEVIDSDEYIFTNPTT